MRVHMLYNHIFTVYHLSNIGHYHTSFTDTFESNATYSHPILFWKEEEKNGVCYHSNVVRISPWRCPVFQTNWAVKGTQGSPSGSLQNSH